MDEASSPPWICPRCGAPTNADNCPNCLQERPSDLSGYNRPGSYFAIVQGRQGFAGLSRPYALILALGLLAIIGYITVECFRFLIQ